MAQVRVKELTGIGYPLSVCCSETRRSSFLKMIYGQIVRYGLILSLLGDPNWPLFAFTRAHLRAKEGKYELESICT